MDSKKNTSTEHNLIHVTNYVSNAINNNKFAIGIFFDLKKAFDVCSHKILFKKLAASGIIGTPLLWFTDYLTNRKQVVDISGNLSETLAITIGVLQGSTLGPTLFLIYINDLPYSTILLTLMFADDTFCADSDHNLANLINRANIEIKKIAKWFRANKMAANVTKTKYVIFHAKGKPVNLGDLQLLYDDNDNDINTNPQLISPIERIYNSHPNKDLQAYKLLGIYLDENLSFNYHINLLINKLNRSLYCINRSKNFLTKKALLTLYFALIHSHLNYCPTIVSCANKNLINKITLLQKKAIRVITKSNYNAHTGPLFKSLNILTYESIILQAKLSFMHSVFHNYAPKSFNNVWEKRSDTLTNNHMLRNVNDYTLPHPRTEQFKKLTLYSLPNAWNTADDFKLQPNRTTFKISLRLNLLTAQ